MVSQLALAHVEERDRKAPGRLGVSKSHVECRLLALPLPTVPEPEKRITVALDAEIVARARNAVADGDLPDAVVVERALNAYLFGRLLDTSQAGSPLAADEADRLAVEEVRAYRRERDTAE